jgi:hypothetical protein
VIQFDRWIRFDKEFYKFVLTNYGVELLTSRELKADDKPSILAQPNNDDVAMSELAQRLMIS